ncbi:putative methyltransferase-like protein 25 isoform X1 [Gouania willdenowi]|uniref:putative methyltransferase-like protein 25 isoform X1 n=1 Tax=Gouania willdenowi TaxID=441366 RepID=UPI0010543532|nr:methyltransferase-like protein 25 isoform X1 [Gouania willdenowi]
MTLSTYSLGEIQQRINEVRRFLSVTLNIANAHTVEFYTHDVWERFIALPPAEVLSAVAAGGDQQREPASRATAGELGTTFGFCPDTKRLVDVCELLRAAQDHTLPGLGVFLKRDELLQELRGMGMKLRSAVAQTGSALEPDEFMNSKKSHEVQSMSEVVACLAQHCRVKQVIDVGSGKGYLSSFLSLQHGLQVYGVDSSSTNTHGAQERNRKLRKFSRAYQQHMRGNGKVEEEEIKPVTVEEEVLNDDRVGNESVEVTAYNPSAEKQSKTDSEVEELFLTSLSVDAMEIPNPRVPPTQLSPEEKEKRKRENLERKARNRSDGSKALFSPLTSFITAETELREIITELEDAVMVGLHTCGDLASNTLRMFVAKPELVAVCSVGCCYHLLSEEFLPEKQAEDLLSSCGFPLSQSLRDQSWFCGRNARMSACLALERVSVGQGIQMESLFYRAVLHVILRDHYSSFKSEKRVGNVYSKTKSFVDYVRRALRRLELDEAKLSDNDIQRYHDTYRERMDEMHAFNMLKVSLAPCIEGLILLDRLCFLKEQENVSFSALVQLFDPLLSPRCYAVVGLKSYDGRPTTQ